MLVLPSSSPSLNFGAPIRSDCKGACSFPCPGRGGHHRVICVSDPSRRMGWDSVIRWVDRPRCALVYPSPPHHITPITRLLFLNLPHPPFSNDTLSRGYGRSAC